MSQPSEPATALTPAGRFQEMWLQGGVPDLDRYVESVGPLSSAELVAVLRVDLAERWRAHDRQPSEVYLARFPHVAADAEAALDLIYAEFLLRKKLGPRPTIAEFVERFPRYAAQLGPQLQLDVLAESADCLSLATSRHELPAAKSVETFDHFASTEVSPPPAGGHDAGPPVEFADGRVIGNYRLIRELGRGGMGTVWEAEMLGSGRRVALKMVNRSLSPGSEEAAQFLREAQTAASISHPRSSFVLEAGWHAGQPFLVMELMPGKTLRSVVVEHGLTPTQAIDYLLDVLEGVEAAHQRGIVHRDIKPANCFLDGEGRATIGDYGLALPLLEDPLEGRFAGTPAFASPEQIRVARLDERSDQYSLGATLYFLLARRPPFVGSFTSLIAQVAADPPPPLANYALDLPRGLERIIRRTLEKDPARRYASLAQLRQALLPFSSTGTFLANVGRRLAAYAIDDALLIAVGTGVLMVTAMSAAILSSLPIDVGRVTLIVLYLFMAAYFTVAEGWYGCGAGKWLVGLRVVGPDGGPPGLARAALRTFFVPFAAGCILIDLFIPALQPLTQEAVADFDLYKLLVVPGALGMVSNLVLFAILAPVFLRRDFLGVHDLVSGTRVVALKDRARAPSAIVTRETKIASGTVVPWAYGPYQQVVACHEPANPSPEAQVTLYEATDDVLRRRVRIVVQPASEAPAYNRVNLSRPTRNRWLQGGHQQEQRWDAYETAGGRPILKALQAGPLDWETMRVVLLDLATEIPAATDDGTLPPEISLRHLYLTTAGRLQLFDYPLVVAPDSAACQGKHRGWQLFQQLMQTAGVSPDWPVHARQFCAQTLARTDREGALEWAAEQLRARQLRPATFRWDDRLGLMSLALAAQGWLFSLLMFGCAAVIARIPGVDTSIRFVLLGVTCAALPGLTTLLFGRSLLLRFLHIQIRRADGAPAGRVRAFARTVLAWLPWILANWLFGWTVGTVAQVIALDGPDPHDALRLMRPPFLMACFFGGFLALMFLVPSAWFTLLHPNRGLAERFSGTRLVYD